MYRIIVRCVTQGNNEWRSVKGPDGEYRFPSRAKALAEAHSLYGDGHKLNFGTLYDVEAVGEE